MKHVLSFLVFAAFAALPLSVRAGSDSAEKSELPEQASNWAPGPSQMWEVSYDAALDRAAEEHKKIFVVCTGSDWCGYCIKLRKEVLTNPKFVEFAEENLVLLYLDFPKEKKLPAKQQKHNTLVCEMLKIMEDGVPDTAVLDEKGRVIARKDGYASLDDYLDFLKKAIRKKASR